jgi:large subunit ribosomal protein L13
MVPIFHHSNILWDGSAKFSLRGRIAGIRANCALRKSLLPVLTGSLRVVFYTALCATVTNASGKLTERADMKTYIPKEEDMGRKWVLVDAKGQVLGRLAVKIADILRGKNKPCFAPHLDCGDSVVVINAREVVLTGRKDERKVYQDFTGYMGGLLEQTAEVVRERNPERLIRDAVWGMLPKGALGRKQIRKMRVYADAEHGQVAQKPVKLEV